MELYNADCLEQMPKLQNKSIDLVLVDLPYGQTNCEWDVIIDMNLMWNELKRIGKDNCQFVFFTTTKFGNKLINSNPSWFRYDIVWEKSNVVGFLNANKMPLRQHEMIYIFSRQGTDDIELNRNLDNRKYAESVRKYINLSLKKIATDIGNLGCTHFLGAYKSSQFGLPTKETYDKLIELYKIDKMSGFIQYDELKLEQKKVIYNPQKTPGKPYKGKEHINKNKDVYGQKVRAAHENISGDRHPTSILKFNGEVGFHRTQKPVELCKWLIKTYSNDGDVVLDFTMGSGSTGVACLETNRRFIGIEKDVEIFKVAKNRLENNNI